MELLKCNEAGFCNESRKLDRSKRMRVMGSGRVRASGGTGELILG